MKSPLPGAFFSWFLYPTFSPSSPTFFWYPGIVIAMPSLGVFTQSGNLPFLWGAAGVRLLKGRSNRHFPLNIFCQLYRVRLFQVTGSPDLVFGTCLQKFSAFTIVWWCSKAVMTTVTRQTNKWRRIECNRIYDRVIYLWEIKFESEQNRWPNNSAQIILCCRLW